jgi:hypothetical protein
MKIPVKFSIVFVALLVIAFAVIYHSQHGQSENKPNTAASGPVPVANQIGEPAVSIIKYANRVEVFRVGEPGKPTIDTIDTCSITSTGNDQGSPFADSLSNLVLADSSYDTYDDLCVIDPAVIFRLWHGAQHVDVILCFTCNELQVVTDLPNGDQQYLYDGTFSPVRLRFLELAKRALPHDKVIQRLE